MINMATKDLNKHNKMVVLVVDFKILGVLVVVLEAFSSTMPTMYLLNSLKTLDQKIRTFSLLLCQCSAIRKKPMEITKEVLNHHLTTYLMAEDLEDLTMMIFLVVDLEDKAAMHKFLLHLLAVLEVVVVCLKVSLNNRQWTKMEKSLPLKRLL